MATPKEHTELIRKRKFSIGGEPNPLIEDLHQAVRNLSAELYTKDAHFLMELIQLVMEGSFVMILQNAEDNEYLEGVDPSLEFVITSRDITATGAPATLLIFNNEKGFYPKNIDSICSVGRSTKKGNRRRGYIGEKGIGFKSVFLISAQPYIFSNGYQIRFNEAPCSHCGLGYIVPEWIDENPTLDDIRKVYGLSSVLPTTVIVLPLKPDKVKPVQQQLSSIEPEVLLFLSNIKRLSVREDNEDPLLNSLPYLEAEVSCHAGKQSGKENGCGRVGDHIGFSEPRAFAKRDEIARGLCISSNGDGDQFPLHYSSRDFVLSSSRETILLDNKWNQGILECVPSAFVNAFISLVKMTDEAPVSSLCRMFNFLPVDSSLYPNFNAVREIIRSKLVDEDILPSDESCTGQKFFHKPLEVGRIMPAFWDIVKKARKEGLDLYNVSSHGVYILHSSFDVIEYDNILNFLGVGSVNNVWYARCIKSSNLVLGVSEGVYLDLLLFLAENWNNIFHASIVMKLPLLKYVDHFGCVSLCSIGESTQRSLGTICRSHQSCHISWMIGWNKEFSGVTNRFFLPQSTQNAICSYVKKETVLEWLQNQAQLFPLGVYNYAAALIDLIGDKPKLAITYAHFLYHSSLKKFVTSAEVDHLCGKLPLVNKYGNVNAKTERKVLVPANGSKWNSLVGSNPLKDEGYIELGEEYLHPRTCAGQSTPGGKLLLFLKSHVAVLDIPSLSPPNAAIPAVSSPLSKENTFLLLYWIRDMKKRKTPIPERFLTSIKNGNWLRVTINGSYGYKPPAQSFFYSSSLGDVMQNGSVFVDIPLIDQSFYGERISDYREELKTIGVMFEYGDACQFIGDHLMRLASSSRLSKDRVLSILGLIKYLRTKYLPPNEFICSIKEGRWLKTSHGYRSPVGAVLFDDEWKTAIQLSDVPLIDKDFYGDEILGFKVELGLLGVIVGFNGCHQLVVENLKQSSHLTSLKADAFHLSLECMRYAKSPGKLVSTLRDAKCLKTNLDYKTPSECFLFDQEWGCLLQVFGCFPLVDHSYYETNISCYKNELNRLGVVVDFDVAAQSVIICFRQHASTSCFTKDNVFSLLTCCRQLKGTSYKFPSDLKKCIHEEKWLRTRLGDFRSPKECILAGPEWESISSICLLPFIDDSNNYYGKDIHKYRDELKSMGVVVEFKTGARFVPSRLCFPHSMDSITPSIVLSLLRCLRVLLEDNYTFPEEFLSKVSKSWLKTYVGYMSPGDCLLFDGKSDLKPTDGPFIDEGFYGSEIRKYRKELSLIGVTVDAEKGSTLLASHLDMHSNFATIIRIYKFLAKVEWSPDNEAKPLIWIPDGNDNGRWVKPYECVLHDKDGLFGMQFNVLDKHYKNKVPLQFFSGALGVKSNPSLDDYCRLWKGWETSGHRLSHDECCAFWRFVLQHKSSKKEKMLSESLEKVPVDSGSDGIMLLDKNDVFIGDDLQLKDLFVQSSSRPLFVWYPQPSLPHLPQTMLFELYKNVGVRVISKSVQKQELSLTNGPELKQSNPGDSMIGKGLLRLILGFLACSSMNLEADKRHETVQPLLNLTVLETSEPVEVRYTLLQSSGGTPEVRASRKVRWDKASSKLYFQKMDESAGQKDQIEYATYFSETIAEGLLWEKEDQISSLSELIKLTFMLKFDEDAVGFVMKSKNLQVFVEDEEFLSAAFPNE
ncbi:DNA binding,ATP binding, putative isoform 2 [Hibiscus syriacus]|uniref:DNA binding,ATP binding, putative isoform 2 n=1 Tax=Hibiscus syriacus TaxID=106335 RepID=A0A6A3CD46_HIBSY|nr:DNA binding,ATP binding, putative isoform 2 [Hibiscus syriacus]